MSIFRLELEHVALAMTELEWLTHKGKNSSATNELTLLSLLCCPFCFVTVEAPERNLS